MEETENKGDEVSEEKSAPVVQADSADTEIAATSEAPGSQPSPVPQAPTQFPGELSLSFHEVLGQIAKRNQLGFLLLVFLQQPIFGALPHQLKDELEARIENKMFFSAAVSTGLNILFNFIAYPIVFMLLAVAVKGIDVLFSQSLNSFILLGFFFALVEGLYRLKEGVFQMRPEEDLVLRGAFYGGPMVGPIRGIMSRYSGLLRRLPVPVEGFYGKGFVEKLERERRYGQAYTIEDLGEAYHLRMEFPRKTPDIGLPGSEELSEEMPDYAYELVLRDGHFVIKGRCVDEKVKKLTGNVGAFPPGFTTVIPLKEKVESFSHRYEDKLLEVLLLKGKSVSTATT